MSTINEVGIKEIHEFFSTNHKSGGDHFNQEMLNAWVAKAETQLNNGNGATIEIRAADSISGHIICMTVSDAGIDKEVIYKMCDRHGNATVINVVSLEQAIRFAQREDCDVFADDECVYINPACKVD